jgi:parvulin-like peptidyl-prolyl isomerase
MNKRVLALAILVVLLGALVAACGSSSVPKGAIAKVGSGAVTQAQFDKIISEAQAQAKASSSTFPAAGSPQYDGFASRVVDYLVELELIHQQADVLKITVTDKEVTARIDAINKAYGGVAKVATILKQQGMTPADLRQQVKDQLIAEAVQKNVYKSINVTDAQAQAYFTANPTQFAQPETRATRHILVKTKAEADKVRALLAANPSDANWKKVAKQYSIDPGSKNSGGSLGPVKKGEMIAAFEKVDFSLKVGQISQPVHTQYGWHVIEVTKITPATKSTFAAVKSQIKQTLLAQQQQTVWSNWLTKVKKDTKIAYAKGYDPAELTKLASASASPAATAPAASSSATPSASPSK